MFEVSAQIGIVDGYETEMNISVSDLTKFFTALMDRHDPRKGQNDLFGRKGTVEIIKK